MDAASLKRAAAAGYIGPDCLSCSGLLQPRWCIQGPEYILISSALF